MSLPATEAVVPGRTDGAVGHNRKCVALWLALYGHYYNFDATHLYGWCTDNADTIMMEAYYLWGTHRVMGIGFCV